MVGTSLIIEAENIIPGGPNDDWDYKESGNKYYARKKGTANWILATGSAERAIKKDIFKRQVKKIDVSSKIFKSQEQGDAFRKYVNTYHKNVAKKHNLSNIGPYDNENITNAANEIVKSKTYGKIKLSDLFFKQNKDIEKKGQEKGFTLPSLVKTGFEINKNRWESDKGYYVDKCTQKGCAEYTYDMIGNVFGDAWQAYMKFNKYATVSPGMVQFMTKVFNNINKVGMPNLNEPTSNDADAQKIIKTLIPSNQQQFNKLPLGTVVGLYYPKSSNFDLAFFQSAIGKSRDNAGNFVSVHPNYFCKSSWLSPKSCSEWNYSDAGESFAPSNTLENGKSFIPNTHIGFIGHIDQNGLRYVVHNVHQEVFAFPVNKMNKDTLSIVWAGSPKVS